LFLFGLFQAGNWSVPGLLAIALSRKLLEG